jgi:hypothetical protein
LRNTTLYKPNIEHGEIQRDLDRRSIIKHYEIQRDLDHRSIIKHYEI